jgi:hypothetical protein
MNRWQVCLTITSACLFLLLLTACTTVTKVLCPQLAPPPPKVVDSLETLGRQDASSAAWTIALEHHYEKLDTCRP